MCDFGSSGLPGNQYLNFSEKAAMEEYQSGGNRSAHHIPLSDSHHNPHLRWTGNLVCLHCIKHKTQGSCGSTMGRGTTAPISPTLGKGKHWGKASTAPMGLFGPKPPLEVA